MISPARARLGARGGAARGGDEATAGVGATCEKGFGLPSCRGGHEIEATGLLVLNCDIF